MLLALDYYDYRLHKGVNQVAAQQGWNLVCTQSMAGAQAVPWGWQGEGIISLEATKTSKERLAQYNLPRIELGLEASSKPLIRVVPDNQKIADMAAEYFIQRGVKSFLIAPDTDGMQMLESRKASFEKSLSAYQALGVAVNMQHLERQQTTESASLFDAVDKQALIEQLRNMDKPAGFLGYDDEMAMHFMNYVRQQGFRVPEDFSVLGIDNNDLFCEGLDVTLSSIETDLIEVGVTAAQKLAELFDEHSDLANRFHTMQEDHLFALQPKKVITRSSTDAFSAAHPMVNRALNVIIESLEAKPHPGERRAIPNASQLAEQLGMTQQGLQLVFREHYHCSPAAAIRQLSLRYAQNMLREPDVSLKQVAFYTGFSSPESLSRCFKQAFGVSPGKWRSE